MGLYLLSLESERILYQRCGDVYIYICILYSQARFEPDLAKWLERLTANVELEVATVLGSIPASSDTVESEGPQMKQC